MLPKIMTGINRASRALRRAVSFCLPVLFSLGTNPCFFAIKWPAAIRVTQMKMPGSSPALNRSPMDCSAATPYMISPMLGGMMTPSSADEATVAAAKFRS